MSSSRLFTAVCLGVHLILLGLAGCQGSIAPDDCDQLKREDACEDAVVDGEGQCHWVDVYKYRGDGTCELEGTSSECVGIIGTQQGCGSEQCGDDEDDAAGNPLVPYYRTVSGGGVAVFDNPVCGPMPVGDWKSCLATHVAECACLCEGS